MRIIKKLEQSGITVIVYRDPEYNEYQIKTAEGVYYTDDKQDAFDTAGVILDKAQEAQANAELERILAL